MILPYKHSTGPMAYTFKHLAFRGKVRLVKPLVGSSLDVKLSRAASCLDSQAP